MGGTLGGEGRVRRGVMQGWDWEIDEREGGREMRWRWVGKWTRGEGRVEILSVFG